MLTEIAKLGNILNECKLHIKRMFYAYSHVEKLLPMDIHVYNNLQENEIAFIDQFLYRFTKLQDTMSSKLFVLFLDHLHEDYKNKPFRDILNRLERLGYLESDQWLYVRELRNKLAHEYLLNNEKTVELINEIISNSKILESVFNRMFDEIQLR